ncbi:autophagy-related protein 13b-like isoform X1 [Iris pallida]|uniref:Autophagy-related protein 13b-like isoform X1 n=1 Tax=Iris pallida TaxID=29817 RepID=A0AAX6FUB5_IRIPA|nr:autophagy-related protein 13b-like isoform X1 [Iris pallida]
MASSPSNSVSEPARIEQVITEFFAKSLHIILESRSPYVSSRNYCGDHFTSSPCSSSSSSSGRPRDKWFNLALRDCPAALENFDLWRQSNLDPLVIDVVLIRRQSKDPWISGQDEFLADHRSEKIVERWIVQYESRKSSNVARELHLGGRRKSGGSSSHSSEIPSVYKKIYKRTIILLRSLYCTVRILPAYKVFRDLNSSGRICPFSLSHKISSFAEPFTRAEDAEMNNFSFASVDTPCGRLSLSVTYAPTLQDVISEPSTPISAQFIPDYVGSPTTDRLKRLHSLPSGGSLPTYVSFTRRHSFSNDHGITPSVSPSPSPTYSDSRTVQCSRNPGLPPRSHPPDHIPSTCLVPHIFSPLANKKNTSFDEYWPSPPFSPSSSPSPPTHLTGSHLQNALLRSESAPLSIPLPTHQALAPSPSRKSGKAEFSSQADLLRAQVTTTSPSHTSSPESKLQLKKLSGEFYIGMNLQKILYSGKDEVGNLSGRKISSCTSPRIPSRSSSRFSLLDEIDDTEFACPFAVDDEELRGSCRVGISDVDSHAGDSTSGELIPFRRSSDAAVGALVRMLKTAAPLRQDLANSAISSQANKEEAWTMKGAQDNKNNKEAEVAKFEKTAASSMSTAPGFFESKTTSDALGELRCYRQIKESILSKHGSQQLDIGQARKAVSEVSECESLTLDIGQAEKPVSEGIEGGPHSFCISQPEKLNSEGLSEL